MLAGAGDIRLKFELQKADNHKILNLKFTLGWINLNVLPNMNLHSYLHVNKLNKITSCLI